MIDQGSGVGSSRSDAGAVPRLTMPNLYSMPTRSLSSDIFRLTLPGCRRGAHPLFGGPNPKKLRIRSSGHQVSRAVYSRASHNGERRRRPFR